MEFFQLKFDYLKTMNLSFKKHFRIQLLNKHRLLSIIKINSLKYGNYGLQVLNSNIVTYKQINSFRIKVSRSLKKLENLRFKIYIRIFFIYPMTQKPKLTRMGKGSGSINKWVACLRPGLVFIEISTEIPKSFIQKSFYLSSYLLSFSSLFLQK